MNRFLVSLTALLIASTSTLSCSGGANSDDTSSKDDTAGGESDCPEQGHFLDVSKAVGAGDGYAAPELSVTCEGDTLVVQSNGMPHYTFVPITPNALAPVDWRWDITRSPVVADAPTSIPLLGYVGFAVNGVPFYGPNEGEFPDPYGDPIYNDIMDGCAGHVGMEYHNHALLVKCLIESSLVEFPWNNDEPSSSEPSPIVGYASDGFPIYGPLGCTDEACSSVIEFKSSWVQTGDPSTYAWDNHEYRAQSGDEYLDRCNGRIGPDGTYRYHTTARFLYILGCYSGTSVSGDDGGNN